MEEYPSLSDTEIQGAQRLERILRMTIILARSHGHEQGVRMAKYVTKLIESQLTLPEYNIKVNEMVGQSFNPKVVELFEANLPHLRAEVLSGRLDIDRIIIKAVGQ
uniref:TAFH domain-containing protein n=1 Tax=Panagrellus redivivus TaxID=6233 RepID=A0A7E4V914_PANRE